MNKNIKYGFAYVLALVLTFCTLQPVKGQVPEKQVEKEAGKLLEADIELSRIGLELPDPGENPDTSHTDNVLPGKTLAEEVNPGKAPAQDAIQGKARAVEGIQIKPSDELFEMYAAGNPDLLGYCFASSARGRFENFEYFILYDTSLVVQKVKVWKYRSSHGGAVAGKRWLRQFKGYRKGELAYGRDVQAISGATISGNALVSEVVRAGEVMGKIVAAMQ